MIATARNANAPAGVEDPAGAAPCDASGDGIPLRASYADGSDLGKAARAVVFVDVRTGQHYRYELRAGLSPRMVSGSLTSIERMLVHDEAADPQHNAVLAGLALAAIRQHGTAKHVPVILAQQLVDELDRVNAAAKLQSAMISELRAQIARVSSRSAS
jgi:hypothetical protein